MLFCAARRRSSRSLNCTSSANLGLEDAKLFGFLSKSDDTAHKISAGTAVAELICPNEALSADEIAQLATEGAAWSEDQAVAEALR
jgi:hypothetical protein